jgi:hypothetical protein
MWHFQRGTRFPNHHPTPIAEDLLEPGTFIFLGSLRRRREDDLKVILSDFDLLLPLYKFVESNGSAVPEARRPFSFAPAIARSKRQRLPTRWRVSFRLHYGKVNCSRSCSASCAGNMARITSEPNCRAEVEVASMLWLERKAAAMPILKSKRANRSRGVSGTRSGSY